MESSWWYELEEAGQFLVLHIFPPLQDHVFMHPYRSLSLHFPPVYQTLKSPTISTQTPPPSICVTASRSTILHFLLPPSISFRFNTSRRQIPQDDGQPISNPHQKKKKPMCRGLRLGKKSTPPFIVYMIYVDIHIHM